MLLVKALFHVYRQLLDDIYKQNLLHYITATSVDQCIDLIIDFSLLRARWIDINRNGTPIDNITESEYKYHVTLSRSLFHILVSSPNRILKCPWALTAYAQLPMEMLVGSPRLRVGESLALWLSFCHSFFIHSFILSPLFYLIVDLETS